MSTKTIAQPEILLEPSDDGRRTKIRKRVAMAVLGLTAVSGIALAVGADSTRSSPAPVAARSEPAISPGPPQTPEFFGSCLADIECYGESQLLPDSSPPQQPVVEDVFAWCMRGVDCPPTAAPQAPGPDENGSSYASHD